LNGWLDKFKKHATHSYKTVSRKSGSIYEGNVGAWKTGELPSLLSKYQPKDAYNADNCGLFFNPHQ
jgi:hypothetical protein